MLHRLGLAAIHHPRRALAIWILAVVVSIATAPVLFSALTTDMGGGDNTESARAHRRMDELFAQLPPADRAPHNPELIALVDGLTVDDPATEASITAAATAIAALPGVTSVLDTYTAPDA